MKPSKSEELIAEVATAVPAYIVTIGDDELGKDLTAKLLAELSTGFGFVLGLMLGKSDPVLVELILSSLRGSKYDMLSASALSDQLAATWREKFNNDS